MTGLFFIVPLALSSLHRKETMKKYLRLVKFSHTVFALPFALLAFTLAVDFPGEGFSWYKLILVLLCMVFARNTAMGFNRWADRNIDKLNPRTATREIPAGVVSVKEAGAFVVFNALLFIIAAFMINMLCGFLAPVALTVVMGYSYTKRVTPLCHMVLGLGLALAPVGAWLAVTGAFDALPVLLGLVVLFWVSGFDIIYALQDIEFDREHDLRSIPSWLGAERALNVARIFHVISAAGLLLLGMSMLARYPETSWISWIGIFAFIGLLIYQHTQVKADDLSKVDLAFFTSNGVGSIVLGGLIILDHLI